MIPRHELTPLQADAENVKDEMNRDNKSASRNDKLNLEV